MIELCEILEKSYLPSRLGTSKSHAKQFRFTLAIFSRWLEHPATVADFAAVGSFLLSYSDGRSPQTVNSKRAYLLALWRHSSKFHGATALGEIRKMPERLDPPQSWTIEDMGRIITACQRSRGFINGIWSTSFFRSLIFAAYDTGARIGQLLNVAPADVNLPERMMLLRAAAAKDGRGRIRQLSDQSETAIQLIWSDSRERLWPWDRSHNALQGRINRILDWAGVKHGRGQGGNFHKFRRTSGTLVEAAGGDGSRHIGNSRKVFEKFYLDPRIVPQSQLSRLPRPLTE